MPMEIANWTTVTVVSQRPQYSDFNPVGGLVDDKADIKTDVAGLRTFLAFGSDSEDAGWAKGIKLTLNFGLDYRNNSKIIYEYAPW